MAIQPLAVKYRPKNFSDITEQDNIKVILQQQLETNTIKNTYLFCGPAGDGKTTTARILANEINKGQGNPIELDAASNNSVDDMRELIAQAKMKSLDSEYKCFIIDECHMITTAGWNAVLKLIEEPPAKSIFIFCTTDPQKIPKTILSRVQRYDFKMISVKGIVTRLKYICETETKNIMEEMGDQDSATDIEWAREQHLPIIEYGIDTLEYIAKLADGHMRDAITMLDKCLSFSKELSLENVVKALGTVDYDIMIKLTDCIYNGDSKEVIRIIEDIHSSGKDLKQFIKQYMQFMLECNKYAIGCEWDYISLPKLDSYIDWLSTELDIRSDFYNRMLKVVIDLNTDIKYSSAPKYEIESTLLLECEVKG